MGLSYRFLQFQRALFARPSSTDMDLVQRTLNPAQFEIFLQLQPSEQAHSLNIFHALRSEGHTHPDLLAAALLHDVGKSRYPLKTWERVVIVLGRIFLPQQTDRWGKGQPIGWKRPFAIARQHAAWGAEMAANTGGSDILVELIRRHQEALPAEPTTPADQLLIHLKRYDDQA